MKNLKRVIFSVVISIIIFGIANLFGSKIHLNINFIMHTFSVHSIMLLLSIITIMILKNKVNYRISSPKLRNILKPIGITLLVTILSIVFNGIFVKVTGRNIEGNPLMLGKSTLQIFLFVFIYASISEELLFRGFLLNFLKPLNQIKIGFWKIKISLSIFISALIFGLVHLILLTVGASLYFTIFTIINAFLIGMIAGYYQEKYNNNAFAIIVHMTGNSIAVFAVFLINLTVN